MPTRKQELEAQIEALEAEVEAMEGERDEYRDALLQADDEVKQIRHRMSPEYQAELEAKLLSMDHHDVFKAIAPTLGLLPRALNHAWKILQADGLYVTVGKPAPAAIEHAVGRLRQTHDFMFSASAAAPPERWLPSGPPTNGHAK